jgi:hypothetical protein
MKVEGIDPSGQNDVAALPELVNVNRRRALLPRG